MLEWGEEEGGARVASDQKGGTIARSQRAFCKSLDLIVCWTHPLQRFVISLRILTFFCEDALLFSTSLGMVFSPVLDLLGLMESMVLHYLLVTFNI